MKQRVLPPNVPLYTTSPIELATSAGEDLSDPAKRTRWIQVAKVGQWLSNRYGEIKVTPRKIVEMMDNWRRMEPPTQVHVDYDHLSTNIKQPGDGIAAGWFQDLQVREAGSQLWAKVEFTVPAAERIRNKEYRFISPTFFPSWTDKITGKDVGAKLVCCALTNMPYIEGMAAVSLSSTLAEADSATTPDIAIPTTPQSAPSRATGENMKMLKLKAADGSDIEVSEDSVIGLDIFKQLQTQITGLQTQLSARPQIGADETVVKKEELTSLNSTLSTLNTKVVELSTKMEDESKARIKTEAELKVDTLVRKGLIAADADTRKTWVEMATNAPGSFDAITKTLKPIVNMGQASGVEGDNNTPASASVEFNTKVDEAITAAGGPAKLSKRDAAQTVARQFPQLYDRYRLEMNTPPAGMVSPSIN